jgi:hypothetical protein
VTYNNVSYELFCKLDWAMIYLKDEGFLFIGSPNRWRKTGEIEVHYAQITKTFLGYKIIFSASSFS